MNDCKLIRVMNALVNEPWMILEETHKMLTDIAKNHAFGGTAEAAQHAKALTIPAKGQKREYAVMGNTAVIPCEGVIGRKFDSVLYSSGVTSVDIFERMVNSADDDDEIDSIVLTFDSPGGAVTGVPEAAKAVARAASHKCVIAYADGQMCSAAYYIASQANQIYALGSAQVGSIGVYLALLDYSRAAEMKGLKVEMFKSGKHKGMGQPGTSLTDEQRDMLQARVDKLGKDFRGAVVSGRQRAINDDDMQGQSFAADDAVNRGLIDAVTSFDVALSDAAYRGKQNTMKGRK